MGAGGAQDQVSGLGQSAEQENGFRQGVGHGIGQFHAQDPSGALERLQGDDVPVQGRVGDPLGGELVGAQLAQRAGLAPLGQEGQDGAADAAGRSIGLQAAALAARAGPAFGVHHGVAQFAGGTVGAVDHLAVHHQAAAQAGAQGDDDEVAQALGGPEQHLPHRGGVGVVGHRHGELEVAAHQAGQVGDLVPGQVHRVFDRALGVVGVGHPDADAHELEVLGQLPLQAEDGVHHPDHQVLGPFPTGGQGGLGQHVAVPVHEAERRGRAADIDTNDHMPGVHARLCHERDECQPVGLSPTEADGAVRQCLASPSGSGSECQSPKLMPRSRAVLMVSQSSGTWRMWPATSSMGT